ncbi:MAG: carboxypeptidase regulatory-like domain-containing protein [Gemmatimonadota bacterium]|nr:carboxypeptidase regulatory-like domain-containing protein [Gemmatimonadota bacterium]
MRRLVGQALAALTLVVTLATTAFAQNTVILMGVVKADGQPLADAQVTITNVATQETVRSVSKANGEFRVLGLFTGQYAVTVRAIGYKPTGQKVQLVIGQRARLEFNMEKGISELAAQTIIGEKVKQVEVQRLSVSAPVLRAEIENLPLNARGLMNLAGVAPGIKTYAPQSGRTLPSAGGAPDLRFFNVYVDGVEMKSLFNGNIVGLGQTGSPLPQEALEQFRVFVNPYDAEYSRAGSYVISTESRRGTNKWEGSAFGFLQNKDMITQNAFQAAVPNYNRQQLGFNLRGPLQKDKLFLAASYELTNTAFYLDVNPTSGPWSAYKGSFLAPNKNHTLFTRLTYVQSPKFTYDAMLSARYLDGEGNFGGRTSQGAGISQNYDIYTAQLRQRYLKPGGNFSNEASLQLVSWSHNEAPLKPGPQFTYPGIIFGTSGFPLILKELHLRAVDRATWTIDNASGSHTIKAGVELSNISATQDFANNANGTFTFLTDTSSLPYLASIAVGFTNPNGTSDAVAEATGISTGVYINDEWRIKDNFTLSLGIRHDAELNTMNNKYTVPWASDTTLQRLASNGGPLAGFLNRGDRKNQLGNFSPRISFSWDPTRQNKTFVRGGLGIIYDRVTSFMGFQERKNSTWRTYNFTFNNTTNLPTKDPAVLRQRVIAGQSGSPAPILMDLGMKTPKNLQMSLGFGHQFTEQFGLNVDFVTQHLTNLYVQRNPNYTDKSVTPSARKLTPRFGDIILWDDIGEAWYKAFLVSSTYQLNKTRVNLAYTLAWYEGNFDTAALPNFALPFLFDRQRTTGDERHRLVLSTVSPIPFGFNVSAIATVASPRPFTSIDGRDINLDNITGDDYTGGTTTKAGTRTKLPPNAWPNYYRTVDLRLSRQLADFGGKKISFSAEVFNAFNWYNKLSYGGTQFTATGTPVASYGVATGAYAARQMQAGLRVDW